MFRVGLLMLICLWVVHASIAQETNEEIPTNNTVRKKFKRKRHAPKVKKTSHIYTKSTKGTMYGNPCAIDVTTRMGFVYVPLSQGHGKTPLGYFINNFLVKSKLVFTRTPLWKYTLNKRLQDCRLSSGDGIG